MLSEDLSPWTTALTDLGGQRVWSLLVSVFGDLAQEDGAAIEGPVLSAIMTAMDVRPEATRVALHRLRNDGWIQSEKTGRTSRHSLTRFGREETVTASRRIYARPEDVCQSWKIIVTDGSENREAIATAGFTQIAPRIYAGAETAQASRDVLILTGDTVPDWVRKTVVSDRLFAEYKSLHSILKDIDASISETDDLPPVSRAVLRCLIVHNWRRLVLRHPALPPALCPDGWRGHDCHVLVSGLLDRIKRPEPEALSDRG
ncbi:PaaX family transcriptional regulator C-terminal domain-containing protein [Roseobacter sp. S98]|uniref:PaaX family transcriptional regulator C-terminal domain-containing protein n=1 Tax=Roseobacter algicola (ex Choi et al. 2025) (nom. illeg.) TaxID=3092138 RepID=UPI0035C67B6C